MSAYQKAGPLGVCDRCSFRFLLKELTSDRDSPGLLVCKDCNDVADPWRKPFNPRDADISVPRPRPETPLVAPTTMSTVDEDGRVVEGPIPDDLTVYPRSD